MLESKVYIDPEKFAYHFMDSLKEKTTPDVDDINRSAKICLNAYLSSYFLAEHFNQLESANFAAAKSIQSTHNDYAHMSFIEMLKKVFEINEKASNYHQM